MEKQPVTSDSWAENSIICADYFKNARISVDASSKFEEDIEKLYILWLRWARMSPKVIDGPSRASGKGSVSGMEILLVGVKGIRDMFVEASPDAERTASSRVYDIIDNLDSDPHRLVVQMRKMADARRPPFSADSSQMGGVPWTLPTNQRLTSLIENLSHLMTNNEEKLFDVLPAARKNMEKLCEEDVIQMNSEAPQGMESVRKLVTNCDLDPLLRQALAPQITSNNVYERNEVEDGADMRNGNIGSTSRDNRYIGNTSKGANSKLVNGDTIL